MIPLAKVDCDTEKKICAKYDIKSYPTLKFFKKGEVIDYTGQRTQNDIANWVVKKSGDPSTLVECDKIEKIIEKTKFTLLNNAPTRYDAFDKIAETNVKVHFIHTNKTCGRYLEGITFYRHFETVFEIYEGADNKDDLNAFITPLLNPTFFEFGE